MLRRHTQAGLSLLEVIVALVVLSSFGAALFIWAGQTLQTAGRAQLIQRDTELERNITEHAASLNPAAREQGQLETPMLRYSWKATLVKGPVEHVRHPQGLSPYQVSLYVVDYKVTELATGRLLKSSRRELAGFTQVRPRSAGPPGFVPMPGNP